MDVGPGTDHNKLIAPIEWWKTPTRIKKTEIVDNISPDNVRNKGTTSAIALSYPKSLMIIH